MPKISNNNLKSNGIAPKTKINVIGNIRQKISERNNKKILNHKLAAAQYAKLSSNSSASNLLKDEIEQTCKLVSQKVEKSATHIAKVKLGYYGGMFKDKQTTDPGGYDIRRFLKERTRSWTNDYVENEFTSYKNEKYTQIDNEQITDEEKKLKKIEVDKEKEIKATFLRTNLYKGSKGDVLHRIGVQCLDIGKAVNEKLTTKYSALAKEKMENLLKSQFEAVFYKQKSKESTLSEDDMAATSKQQAIATAKLSIVKVSDEVCSMMEEELKKEAEAYIITKRDEIAKILGGKKVGGRYDFKSVSKNDFSSVEDYVYEKDDAKAQVTGLKPLKEVKEELSQKVRGNAIVTNDVNRGFLYFSRAAFSLVHNNGDSSSLETEFKIPVSPGVFFNVKVTGSVEKDDNHVTGKVNLGVGASGEVGIAKLVGEIGGYMEITAKTPEDFAKIISYTFYRQFRESKVIPSGLTDRIWGMGGLSGKTRYEEAEAFNANLERGLFGSDVEAENASKVGAYGKFSGEVGIPGTGVGTSFELKGGAAREYSKSSFEQTNQKDRIGKMEPYKFGGQASKGEMTGNLSLSFEVGAFIGGGSCGVELNFRSGKIEDIELKLGGKLKYAGSDLTSDSLKETIAMAVNSAASFLNSVVKGGINISKIAKNKGLPNNGTEISQLFGGDGGGIVFQAFQTGFTGSHLNNILDKVGESNLSNISEGSLGLEISYDWKPGAKGDLSVTLTTASSAGISFGVGSLKAEKSQRLLKWESGAVGNTMFEKFKGGFAGSI